MVRVTRAFGEVCWWGCSEGHEKGGSECEKQIKGYKEGGVWGKRGWECESKYELRKGAKKRTEPHLQLFLLALPLSFCFLLIRALPVTRDVLLTDTQTVRNKWGWGRFRIRKRHLFSPSLLPGQIGPIGRVCINSAFSHSSPPSSAGN